VVSESPAGPGRRAVTFADSIRMSTYLVAFVVGELEATPPVMVGKTPLRIWCVPGKTHLARVGQQIGAFSLEFFEQYYGLPYPGDKLDLLAIPDFAAGAMENLGAITFRETALLVDEAAASHTEIERVADVVAHEVAHMWFGDLVTMLWWNGIWLNEAFATFMELLAVDAWKPEWKRWVTFGVSRAAAMGVDGLVNTRPIEFEVKAPKDCEAMFDLLTYEKGASVLRMLEQHIGPDVFRDGVRLYLERHQFGNAETTDLWKALGDASRQPIPEVMDGWIFHPGYPLVRVEADGQGLRLSQRRFTYLGEDAAGRWRIPIVLRAWVKRGIIEKHVLLDGDDVVVPLPAAPEWAIVNAGGHGFYRVSYAPPLLKKLSGALPRLSPIERFNLVSDAFALAQSGAMSAAEYLELSARFTEETDRNVWAAITGSFAYLNRVIASEQRSGLEALVATGSPRRWSASAGRSSPRRASSCASSAEISCGRWACWAMIPSRRSAPASSTRGSARATGRWMRTCCPRSSRSWRRTGARRSTRSSGSASALRAPPRRSSGISSPWPAFATPISYGGRSATRSTARCGARTRPSSCARCSVASMDASWPGSSSRSTGRRWRACTRAARIAACTRASPRS
jgi:puromycin-sensitive aminopeptidase